ncbi:hypothetical protein D3C84_640210 [compost metagenome]
MVQIYRYAFRFLGGNNNLRNAVFLHIGNQIISFNMTHIMVLRISRSIGIRIYIGYNFIMGINIF